MGRAATTVLLLLSIPVNNAAHCSPTANLVDGMHCATAPKTYALVAYPRCCVILECPLVRRWCSSFIAGCCSWSSYAGDTSRSLFEILLQRILQNSMDT